MTQKLKVLIEPTKEEIELILKEVADHSKYWESDRCKRDTVEKHLESPPRECHKDREPIKKVTEKIDWMIAHEMLIFLPGRTGGYLQCKKKMN